MREQIFRAIQVPPECAYAYAPSTAGNDSYKARPERYPVSFNWQTQTCYPPGGLLGSVCHKLGEISWYYVWVYKPFYV